MDGRLTTTLQVVCSSGHVGLIHDVEEPDVAHVGHIMTCAQCGARASWKRRRPPVVTLNQGGRPQPEQR